MSSLVSTPKTDLVEVENKYDGPLDESLFSVWKSSKNTELAHRRLTNRSWRLLSEQVSNGTQKAPDKSFSPPGDNQPLTQKASPTYTPMLPKRPSLFLTLSQYTSESVLSMQKPKFSQESLEHASGEESSEISDDDFSDDGYFEYAAQNRNQSVTNANDENGQNQTTIPFTHIKSAMKEEDISPTQPYKAHATNSDSKRDKKGDNKGNIFYISNSPSSQDHEKNGPGASPSSISEIPAPTFPRHVERKDSLFQNMAKLSTSSASNAASSLSSTDISEVSDLEDQPSSLHDNDIHQVIAEARSAKSSRSMRLMDDTESEWMSVSSESELGAESPVSQPIQFTKRITIPKSISENSHSSPPADDTLKSSPSSFKPRSLLSGLFLSEMSGPAVRSPVSTKSASFEHLAPKPVLKRSSTTGVITVDSNNNSRGLQRPSILLSKRYASSSDFTKKVAPHRSPILYIAEEDSIKEDLSKSSERNLFAKQTSSVGLSNFLAMADAKNVSQDPDQKSTNSQFDHDANPAGADTLLSSSLSKFSSLQRESSFKNIFSKSSINLTSLLGHGITGKLRLNSDHRPNDKFSQQPQPPMASLFAEHLSQQGLMEQSRSESTITTGKSVRVEPTTFKDFTPSVQISESLKDSLLIDHKLGKAPLPDRVISNEDLFSGHDKEAFVQESNDYHSKGW